MLTLVTVGRADMLLNWQLTGQTAPNGLVIWYKDKNHILISAEKGLKLLKLQNEVYLMKNYAGFKLAFRLSDFISTHNQRHFLKVLPKKDLNFLPVMVFNGAKQTIQGYEGHILLLKDYHKSVTIVSSHDEQHMAIKDALLPLLIQLTEKLPNLPNRQLIEILKRSEFGLPLRIDNDIILTKSENVRKGPNESFDVAWTYTRKNLPIEIISEYDNWRKIRDHLGAEGWIFHSLLSGSRYALVNPWKQDGFFTIHSQKNDASKVAAKLEAGTLGKISDCDGTWCQISIDSHQGYIKQEFLWGVYPDDTFK